MQIEIRPDNAFRFAVEYVSPSIEWISIDEFLGSGSRLETAGNAKNIYEVKFTRL